MRFPFIIRKKVPGILGLQWQLYKTYTPNEFFYDDVIKGKATGN